MGGTGQPIEYAVKMLQFRREEELDTLLAQERIVPAELAAFGQDLAAIHARLPVAESPSPWGDSQAIRTMIAKNLEECAQASVVFDDTADVRSLRSELQRHLEAAAPWGVRVSVEREAAGEPFLAEQGGPAYTAMAAALGEAYGRPMTTLGQGGSIPLCNVLADTYPGAEIILIGVEEPRALIHAPNESVDPTEIASMAIAEALFLRSYAKAR